MSYILAGMMKISDPSWTSEYAARMPALLARHQGQVLASGPAERFEGTENLPDRLVVLSFPNAAAARAWYDDPDNQDLVALRQTGSTFELFGASA